MTLEITLAKALKAATRGLVENQVLTVEQVEHRAALLFEDVVEIGFKNFTILGLREFKVQANGIRTTIPLVEYEFGEKRNDINRGAPSMEDTQLAMIRNMQGTNLDKGDLTYFARVSEIGHRLIPHLWLSCDAIKLDLRAPGKHLSTLNEVWWLSMWLKEASLAVSHEANINPLSTSTVDWTFTLPGSAILNAPPFKIRLEVKQLMSSLGIAVHRERALLEDLFRGVEGKFQQSGPEEINAVGVTIMCAIDGEIDRAVTSRLATDPLIDAVVVWAPFSRQRTTLVRFNPRLEAQDVAKRAAVEYGLLKPTVEDTASVGFVVHPDLEAREMMFGKP